MLGGYHSFPARLGGAKPVARIYHEALRSALPSAIQSVPGSFADCETLTTARVLEAAWKAQQRYEANLSPSTAFALLGNWAQRFRIQVRESDSVEYIQALCAWKHKVNLHGPNQSSIWDACKLVLGKHFVDVQFRRGTDLATPPADTFWPESPGSEPWTSSRSLITIQATRRELTSDEFAFLMNVRLGEILDALAPGYGSWNWEEVPVPVPVDPSEGFDLLLGVAPDTIWFAEDQSHPQNEFVTRRGFEWSPDSEPGTTLTKGAWGLDDMPTVDFGGAGTNYRVGLRCDEFAPGATSPKFAYTIAGPCVVPNANGILWAFTDATNANVIYEQLSSGNAQLRITSNGTSVVSAHGHGAFPHSQRAIVALTMRPSSGSNYEVAGKVKTSSGTTTLTPYTITSNVAGSFIRFALGETPYNVAPFTSQNTAWGGIVGYRGYGATDADLTKLISHWESKYRLS